MIKIVNFTDEYISQLQEIDFIMSLRVQWDSTVARENVFAAVDENNKLLGICALCCDGTWYYIDDDRTDIPLYRMQMEICIDEDINGAETVEKKLTEAAQKRLALYKEKYPDKKLCIRCWCEEGEYEVQQRLLEMGFSGHNVVWIMKANLEQVAMDTVVMPDNLSFEILENNDESMKEYLEANCLGYDNVQDAEGELRFRLGDERTKVFVTRCNGKIVSSVTVWHISDERAATENIFTIPEYRRQKMSTITILKAFEYLKNKGYRIATLTCVGDNSNAIALYNKLRYKVMGHQLEMHWEI